VRGYRVLAANAWAGRYELDLVLRRGRRLVFCEVKAKSGPGFGDPLEMITDEKVRRLRQAAELWLARHAELDGLEIRYEAVAISPDGLRRVPLA
jgi:putative endonuclease